MAALAATSRRTPPMPRRDPHETSTLRAAADRARWTAALADAGLGALASTVRTAIALRPRACRAADLAPGASRLGGHPDLPPDAPWPGAPDAPMAFVAQLDLAAVAPFDVEGRLPADGLLAFFARWHDDGWDGAVLHARSRTLAPRPAPGGVDVAPARGVDLEPRVELAPYASRFIGFADDALRPTRFDPATGAWVRPPPPRVALPADAHARYGDVYARWRASAGATLHGLLGYDRAMEGEQGPDEVMLLRLDADADVGHDFVEAACLYYLIDRDALARGDFASARAHYGASG